MKPEQPQIILITGASGGIGRALAFNYAGPGVTLYISARNQDRLKITADECRALGATVKTAVIDVQDRSKMAKWVIGADQKTPLQCVIANAGISAGSGKPSGETEDQARDIFSVNFAGVLNTIWPAIHLMKRRKSGQIAIISSLAGFRGLPSAPAYSASKAAVKAYGEGLRGELSTSGIKINVIFPGFVDSGITDKNNFPMPFKMPAEKAAKIIAKGLLKNKARIQFPWPTVLLMWIIRTMPQSLADYLLARAPRKE